MSEVKLITKNTWSEITKSVQESKVKSMVAVAYFGQGGAARLPLTKGSVLLVDASEKALKCGQTCPDELLKLYYKGVHIYSLENLHAKLFVIGNSLYCGSTNVSGRSANHLKEALVKTNDKKAVTDAKEFIKSFCRMELGDEEIKRLSKYYNPPKVPGGQRKEKSSENEFHICKLEVGWWTEAELEHLEIGRAVAEKNRIKKSRHYVDEFLWNRELKFKKGDTILQIITEEHKTYVAPIGKLIHIRKWSNGSKTKNICFVEIPDRKRKDLEFVKRKLNDWDAKSIMRAGRKSLDLEANINSLWKKIVQ